MGFKWQSAQVELRSPCPRYYESAEGVAQEARALEVVPAALGLHSFPFSAQLELFCSPYKPT
jgi:hypothetical protein